MRHANALTTQGQMTDRERPVSQKGWKELDLLKQHLVANLSNIDLIWCSNTKRTRQTIEYFQPFISKNTQLLYVDGLYEVQVGSLLEKLKSLNDSSNSILIIGHNPSLSQLALSAFKNSKNSPPNFIEMATGSLAFLQSDISCWRNLSLDNLIYKNYIDPAYL